jgi:molybdopterin-containing oxidoreductase family iron-sulfur binding subunit
MKNTESNKEIWIGVEQLENDPQFLKAIENEFQDTPMSAIHDGTLNIQANRRDFLKYLGFGLGAATIAASCDIPVKKAIPYVVKPDEIVPGVATYYASSFVHGGDYCPVLVKTREGRPIKVEGNTSSSITKGGTSARVQASVLSLYDTNRYQKPLKKVDGNWQKTDWADIDKEISGKITPESQIRIVTGTILSPTAKRVLDAFLAKFPNSKVVTYDAVSSSALLEANEVAFGKRFIPNYHFDKAQVILSFGADFLGTWISPIEYANQYASRRRIKAVKGASMSRHIQVESAMTLTGSNADNRILVRPSETGAAIAALYNEIATLAGAPTITAPKINNHAAPSMKKTAAELWAAKGKSLVVCGTNNIGEQLLVAAINKLLESFGSTITFDNAPLFRQGIDKDIQGLLKEIESGVIDAVFVWGANPAFDLPNATKFREAFSKVKMKVSFALTPDETTELCDFVAPNSHFLESWGDAEPKQGYYSLIQPTISPLFDTRQAELSLLTWAGSTELNASSEQPYYEYLKSNWQSSIFPKQTKYSSFQAFWDNTLQEGLIELPATTVSAYDFAMDVAEAVSKISKPGTGLEISFFETVNIGNGTYADNPWLQELPDPINRCVWGNHLAIPIEFDGNRRFHAAGQFKGLNEKEYYKEADIVEVDINGTKQKVTCVRQFGQMVNTISIALGYGRTVSGVCGKNIGVNVYPWLSLDANGNTQYWASGVNVSGKVGTDKEFACVQYHHTMGVTGKVEGKEEKLNVDEVALMTLGKGYQGSLVNRSVIRRSSFKDIEKFVEDLRHERSHHQYLNDQTLYPVDQYREEKYSQSHHWGMHIDLNSCIGCGACQIACTAENNVPVVGKREVHRHHEMAWLRIDRYFYGDYENPNVVYQPMLCQHCDNAPCENVCPVSATNHSSEGLNQMIYNRCVGTRYCSNNCPYKVRRFNWYDYTTADIFPANEHPLNGEEVPFGGDNLTRMVLNPDVTVRVRGVMEKCSFCVQRIQEGKLTAKKQGRALMDGEVKAACQMACPTGAITFGDMNNKESLIASELKNELNYSVLEEVNTLPSVQYSARISNKDESFPAIKNHDLYL